MKKILYIVLDGLSDKPIPQLNNKTPLEVAKIPNINSLLKYAKLGLVYTVGKNIAPESDIAVISILGYDAHKFYTGRGPLESYAEGLEVNEGDVAFRVNFATAGSGDEIKDRRVGRNLTTEEATALADEINKEVKLTKHKATFKFKNTIGHRGVLVIYSKENKFCGMITNTDPAYERKGVFGVALEKFENKILKSRPCPGYENKLEAVISADLINEFTEKSRIVLENSAINKKRIKANKLPANLIVSRDAGSSLPKFPKINEVYKRKFGCFVEMPVERGIALLTGMSVVDLPLASGDIKNDYSIRAKKIFDVIDKFDGLYIHIKGPDEPAHDGDFKKKIESIENIDKFFFGSFLQNINLKNFVICVTSDHSTPCILKAHSDDAVPFLVATEGLLSDGKTLFNENTCKTGSIGEITGVKIFPLLIELSK